MSTFHVLIFTNPVAGREAEFHEWYETTHLDDVLATAGFTAAQRFGLEVEIGLEQPNKHLAWYEGEGESAQEVGDRLNSTRPDRELSDSIDGSQVAMWVFSELGERHEV